MKSFVPVAPESHFPIENLPYGVGRPRSGGEARVLTAIGDHVLDLAAVHGAGLLSDCSGLTEKVFAQPTLNPFMALGRPVWSAVRERVTQLLSEDETALREDEALVKQALVPASEFEMVLPVQIGDRRKLVAMPGGRAEFRVDAGTGVVVDPDHEVLTAAR